MVAVDMDWILDTHFGDKNYGGLWMDCVCPLMDQTWWSGVDNARVKEGKRVIFSGLCSRLPCSRK